MYTSYDCYDCYSALEYSKMSISAARIKQFVKIGPELTRSLKMLRCFKPLQTQIVASHGSISQALQEWGGYTTRITTGLKIFPDERELSYLGLKLVRENAAVSLLHMLASSWTDLAAKFLLTRSFVLTAASVLDSLPAGPNTSDMIEKGGMSSAMKDSSS